MELSFGFHLLRLPIYCHICIYNKLIIEVFNERSLTAFLKVNSVSYPPYGILASTIPITFTSNVCPPTSIKFRLSFHHQRFLSTCEPFSIIMPLFLSSSCKSAVPSIKYQSIFESFDNMRLKQSVQYLPLAYEPSKQVPWYSFISFTSMSKWIL